MTNHKVQIELLTPEALVLFDFLCRFTESGKLVIVDRAEERVLWDLLSSLESALIEPFLPDYQQILEDARKNIRQRG
jgi:hypothetical protein